MKNIYLAFVPWILFGAISQHDSVAAAALVALAAAIAIGVPSFAAGRPKILDLGAIAAFTLFAVAGLALGSDVEWLSQYARAIAAGALGLIALGSLLATPFTEQYARETVPREYWDSPRFKAVNRELTQMWGLVFFAMVPSHIVAGLIDTHRANTIFNWVVPVVLIVWAAKRTEAVTAAADEPADREQPVTTPQNRSHA
ncbi:hypothetical protein [Conexibacter sp. CPCC 206217]|uniref:hypothetical protein n=1 Tax=Conexibacter sp. CPCC 206217 TaxID=3064574 RepID=UPI0027276766|nr:hypothetical protein [Conexibacter sp. CPCC 206217]MDO8211756.1 hypothetical protein [Conexibacter sp. CPCC 206217]